MRWDGLFADLEAQAEALSLAERNAEIEERARYEIGRLALADRLRAALGSPVRLSCRGGLVISGRLDRAHPEWLLLSEPAGREVVVATAWLDVVGGLGRASAAPGSGSVVTARLGLRSALRGIARDRSNVHLQLADGGGLDGTLDRVGADYVEVATHPAGEARRRSEVREVVAVAQHAIVALRRDG